MEIPVISMAGTEVDKIELPAEIFEVEVKVGLMHQAYVRQMANARLGTHKTQSRGEVNRSKSKWYRQKGTGRARMGTLRTPLRRGGGTVFGPHPRDYGSKFPKRMKRLAIQSVFSGKAISERIKVVDKIELAEIKTKSLIDVLGKLELGGRKCIILDEGRNDNLTLSCRNIPGVRVCRAGLANGYELLNAEYVVLTKAGLEKVGEVFS